MKKMFLLLATLLQGGAYAQNMFCDFSVITPNGAPICPSFSSLCVAPTTPCIWEWKKIGTPAPVPTGATAPTTGMADYALELWTANEMCEGIFTSFPFNPSKTYNVSVGIRSTRELDKHGLSYESSSGLPLNPNAYLILFSSNDLLQSDPNLVRGCGENQLFNDISISSTPPPPPVWSLNPATNTMSGWWSGNAPSVPNTLVPTGEVIKDIPINTLWSGSVVNYTFTYIPSASWSQFGLHLAKRKLATSSGNQTEIQIEYVKIEEVCTYNSNFGYKYTTFNPLNVDFMSYTYGAPAPYSWQFGDGNVSGIPNSVTNTYPSYGTYHPSLAIGDCLRQFAKVCLNQPDVNNYIPGNTFDPVVVDPKNKPCNPHFEFFGGSTNPYEVGVTTLGGHTGPNAFNVHWGDGTSSADVGPQSFIHKYTAPGSYNICVEADDKRCTVCLPICIEQLGTGDNGGGGPYGPGGEGKNGVTSVSNKNVQFAINSIVPNPAKSSVTLNIDGKTDAKTSIKIFDLTGKVVLSTEKNISIGTNKIDMDVQHLASGVYIIEVKAGAESIVRAKMTKE